MVYMGLHRNETSWPKRAELLSYGFWEKYLVLLCNI